MWRFDLPGASLMQSRDAAMGAMRQVAGLFLSACLLAACASPAGDQPVGERRDLATASDQTDANRRAMVRLELAGAYFSRGQNTTALDEVKQALTADPTLVAGFSLRGLIYAAMGENSLAEDSFKRALQISASDPDTLHNYGWYLCQQRRFAEADGLFVRAAAQPGYTGSARTLMAQGVCQARNDHWADAERTLSRAYELDPSNPATAVNLSEVLLRRGELERARFYIRRVNAVDEFVNAQTLWMAARIERKLGQESQVRAFGAQLVNRFPQSPESLKFEKGLFDE
jgi:type IV pilus assembly protein PilF